MKGPEAAARFRIRYIEPPQSTFSPQAFIDLNTVLLIPVTSFSSLLLKIFLCPKLVALITGDWDRKIYSVISSSCRCFHSIGLFQSSSTQPPVRAISSHINQGSPGQQTCEGPCISSLPVLHSLSHRHNQSNPQFPRFQHINHRLTPRKRISPFRKCSTMVRRVNLHHSLDCCFCNQRARIPTKPPR